MFKVFICYSIKWPEQKKNTLQFKHCIFLVKWKVHLHGVSLPGGGLSICEDSAIVATQHIYETKNKKWDHSAYFRYILIFRKHLFIRTLDNLLGAGVVHLLLGGVGGKHAVKGIGPPLWGTWTTTQLIKGNMGEYGSLSHNCITISRF